MDSIGLLRSMIGRIQTRAVEEGEQIRLFVSQMLRQSAVRRIPVGSLQHCTQSVGRKPNLGRSADAADPGEYYAHLLAAGTGRLSIPDSAPAFPRHSHPGHCTGRGSSRGFAGIKNRISPMSMPATGSRWPDYPRHLMRRSRRSSKPQPFLHHPAGCSNGK